MKNAKEQRGMQILSIPIPASKRQLKKPRKSQIPLHVLDTDSNNAVSVHSSQSTADDEKKKSGDKKKRSLTGNLNSSTKHENSTSGKSRKKRNLSMSVPTTSFSTKATYDLDSNSDDDDFTVSYNPMSKDSFKKKLHAKHPETKPTKKAPTVLLQNTAVSDDSDADLVRIDNAMSTGFSSQDRKAAIAQSLKPLFPCKVTPTHTASFKATRPATTKSSHLAATTPTLSVKTSDWSVARLPRKVAPTYDDAGGSSDHSLSPSRARVTPGHPDSKITVPTSDDDDRKPQARNLDNELRATPSGDAPELPVSTSSATAPTNPIVDHKPAASLPDKFIFDCAMSSDDEDYPMVVEGPPRQSGAVVARIQQPDSVPSKFIFDAALSSDEDDSTGNINREGPRQPAVPLDRNLFDDELSDDTSDDDLPRIATPRAPQTFEDVRADIEDRLLDDIEDEDAEDFLPPLTEQHKVDELAKIEKSEDKAYQILLWKEGFRMTLLSHQFLGSRAVAGLPMKFPYHAERSEDPTQATIERAVCRLPESETRGLLLADDMGLGKTIQAISGSIMHCAVLKATDKLVRPTLIIAPNRALIEQWMFELKRNGVKSRHILYIKSRQKIGTKPGFRQQYIFMTRHTLASETKNIMFQCGEADVRQRTKSSLFPDYTLHFHRLMWRLKKGSDGKLKNHPKRERESFDDCLTRLVRNDLLRNPKRHVFGMVVIDEAHFLKNRVSNWGIGAAMLGVHAERTITMTGTPYCNNSSDVAALQSYIDVTHVAAKTKWWDTATGDKAKPDTIQEVSLWRDQYLVRRRKEVVLKDVLKQKIITDIQVQCLPQELQVYGLIEDMLRKLMEKFAKKATHPRKEKEMQDIMMALMSLGRGCLVHPMIPNGREITIQFSPSRRGIPIKSPEICVYCNQLFRPTVQIQKTVDEEDDDDDIGVANAQGPGIDLDLEDSDLEDDDDDVFIERGKKKKLGKLVRLSAEFCGKTAQDEQSGHFIHEKCLELFHDGCDSRCPRCVDLENRVNFQNSMGNPLVPHKRYCAHIQALPNVSGGFVASTKLEQVLAQFAKIPKGEKVLVLSFFKGALDLLEGIFVEEMGIDCARYDGDMNHEDRKVELDRFKDETKSCRVLLSTVHCCGTGLNIVQANHVMFVDRWFNPTVHDQAMDRCYRIGQTKDVFVSFFDCVGTLDVGMMLTNKHKKENSAILLADGTNLGEGRMSFRQLQGVMRSLIAAQQMERIAHVAKFDRQTPFARVDNDAMTELMARIAQMAEDALRRRRN